MKRSAPDHIRKNCSIGSDPMYLYLCEVYESETSFVYKLKCDCGCEKFVVYRDSHLTVYVYVNYEYSDEFMSEGDVEFDENDITWAKAFIVDRGKLCKILDDETV